jgi:hypothetical protein
MMGDFLKFDKLITPSIIKILFWIGSGICIIYGFATIADGTSGYYNDSEGILQGILIIILGPIVIRIYCEIFILFFKIYETLQAILKREVDHD